MYTCLWTIDPYREYSAAVELAASSMPLRIWLTSVPPPVASNAMVADVALRASVRSVSNDGDAELQTWTAPSDLSSSSWSGLRTMLTSGTSSLLQSLTSIWPRLDAAAVCTRAE